MQRDYTTEVSNFYARYNPAKNTREQIVLVLTKYAGREDELLAKLYHQYGVPVSAAVASKASRPTAGAEGVVIAAADFPPPFSGPASKTSFGASASGGVATGFGALASSAGGWGAASSAAPSAFLSASAAPGSQFSVFGKGPSVGIAAVDNAGALPFFGSSSSGGLCFLGGVPLPPSPLPPPLLSSSLGASPSSPYCCDSSCSKDHRADGKCLSCGKRWGSLGGHVGHCCSTGVRGRWRVAAAAPAVQSPGGAASSNPEGAAAADPPPRHPPAATLPARRTTTRTATVLRAGKVGGLWAATSATAARPVSGASGESRPLLLLFSPPAAPLPTILRAPPPPPPPPPQNPRRRPCRARSC